MAATVRLVESDGESASNGAAYLLQMLVSQAIEKSPRRSQIAGLLSTPVAISLRDTGGNCIVSNYGGEIVVEARNDRTAAIRIEGYSRHLVAVTQVYMPSPLLPVGLIAEQAGRKLLRDIALGRLRIRGLVRHYTTLSRFLFLINIATR